MLEPNQVQADLEAQRRWERHHFHVPVRVIHQSPLHRTEVVGRGSELNEGGICVQAFAELAISDLVELEFSPTSSGLPVRLHGVIRSRLNHQYGVEFLTRTAMEEERATRIGQLLRGALDFRIC
jgi:hypothetical protein